VSCVIRRLAALSCLLLLVSWSWLPSHADLEFRLSPQERMNFHRYVLPVAAHVVVADVVSRAGAPPLYTRGKPHVTFDIHVLEYLAGDTLLNDTVSWTTVDTGARTVMNPGTRVVLALIDYQSRVYDVAQLTAVITGDSAYVYNPGYMVYWPSYRDTLVAYAAPPTGLSMRGCADLAVRGTVTSVGPESSLLLARSTQFTLQVLDGYIATPTPSTGSLLAVRSPSGRGRLHAGIIPTATPGDTLLVFLKQVSGAWELIPCPYSVWHVRGANLELRVPFYGDEDVRLTMPAAPVYDALQ